MTDLTGPADFDIDAWISGAQLPEATVRVSARGNLAATLEEEEAALAAARSKALDDDRLNGPGVSSEAAAIAARIKALHDEMDGSWLTIRLRSLTPAESEQVQKLAEEGDAVQATLKALATQTVEPKGMTVERWAAMRERIGVGQFTSVVQAANRVSYGQVVTPDFSLSALATLATEESSTN